MLIIEKRKSEVASRRFCSRAEDSIWLITFTRNRNFISRNKSQPGPIDVQTIVIKFQGAFHYHLKTKRCYIQGAMNTQRNR